MTLDQDKLDAFLNPAGNIGPVDTEVAGGSRYSAGKAKRHAIPYGAMEYIAEVSEKGAWKYAPYDYMEGQSFSTLLNSAMRHMEVCMRDPLAINEEDGGVFHAAQAAWNLMCLLDLVRLGKAEEMDDITPYRGVTAAQLREAEKAAKHEGKEVLDILRRKNGGEYGSEHDRETGD